MDSQRLQQLIKDNQKESDENPTNSNLIAIAKNESVENGNFSELQLSINPTSTKSKKKSNVVSASSVEPPNCWMDEDGNVHCPLEVV